VIAERLPLTLTIAFATLFFMYAVSIPIGVYSAVRRYSFGDHAAFRSSATSASPSQLPAGARADVSQPAATSGRASAGCSRRQYSLAPWSWEKFSRPACST
jgi:peptide/nickel transport system permease protein